MPIFKYTGELPRNVYYQGCSFPIRYGDTFLGEEEFLVKFIPRVHLKAVSSNVVPKYKFRMGGLSSTVVPRKDPMQGLPIRVKVGREVDPNMEPSSPALSKQTIPMYDMLEPVPKVEVPTGPKLLEIPVTPTAEEPILYEKAVEVELKERKTPPELFTPESTLEMLVETVVPTTPSKTTLRKENKSELLTRVKSILKTLDAPELAGLTEENSKGEIFDALWAYYGMDEEVTE